MNLTTNDRVICREAVETGAALLDRRRPKWFDQIDLDHFDLTSGEYCICGQLAKMSRAACGTHWTAYLRVLFTRTYARFDAARAHGFSAPNGLSGDETRAWAYMERLWRKAIKDRRAAAAA